MVDARRWSGAPVVYDLASVVGAHFLALALRFDGDIPGQRSAQFLVGIISIGVIYSLVHFRFGIYRRAWTYAGLIDAIALAMSILLACGVSLLVDALVGIVSGLRPLPLSVIFSGGVFSFVFQGGIKLAPRIARGIDASRSVSSGTDTERLLVVGAGQAGQWLVRELRASSLSPYGIVGLVDDDPRKRDQKLHGVPVLGSTVDIPDLVSRHAIDVVAIAIPSASPPTLRRIIDLCQRVQVKVRLIPGINEILAGNTSQLLRDVTVEDLLGRNPVAIDVAACRGYLAGRVVLVTGAAGSIGSEIARQVWGLGPSQLVLLDTNESGLHDLGLQLVPNPSSHPVTGSSTQQDRLRLAVGSVESLRFLERVFETYRPSVVFHAAAYKHVPLMEEWPEQAVLVNVVGTEQVCATAARFGVERTVLISTDKAVNPSNVMGATKRMCEEIIRAYGRDQRGIFCAVRFGNVLDSRGSVVPTFRWQIDRGGPVTVTHPDIRRFFMTIPEAASLVVQAGAYAVGGDIFLLDMGDEMPIASLAEKMILLRGLRPGKDIAITYTGLRPGEKLREELYFEKEALYPTEHSKIRRVLFPTTISPDALAADISCLREHAQGPDRVALKETLFRCIAAYDRSAGENPHAPALRSSPS